MSFIFKIIKLTYHSRTVIIIMVATETTTTSTTY